MRAFGTLYISIRGSRAGIRLHNSPIVYWLKGIVTLSELQVGIVGCGRMGFERARCVTALGSKIRHVFDSDQAKSLKLARQYSTKAMLSGEQCINEVDAVIICIPPGYRGSLEEMCIDRGIPFFVEKPIGLSAHDCFKLVNKLEQTPVINGVGYMNRYRRSVIQARDSLRGASVLGMSAHWICKEYGVNWWSDKGLSGGPHNEQATHLFDLSRFLLGEVVEICALSQNSRGTSCTFRFEGDALGTTMYSCNASAKDIGIQIFASGGSITLSGWNFQLTQNTVDGVLIDVEEDIFLNETAAFLEAVRSQKQEHLASNFADALKTQTVMDCAERSWLSRQAVSINYTTSGFEK